MKKLIAVAAVMLSLAVIAKAELYEIPKGGGDALATADYGGYSVDVATLGWSGARTPETGKVVVYGVIFSSGAASDYVIIRDSGTANITSIETARLYNIGSSTAGVTSSAAQAGYSGAGKPIRLNKGLTWNSNSSIYNAITVIYQRIGGE